MREKVPFVTSVPDASEGISWMLRSTGKSQNQISIIRGDGYYSQCLADYYQGVRPAMWIDEMCIRDRSYTTKDHLYIVVGYGEHDRTNLCVVVEELYKTDRAIYIKTDLKTEAEMEGDISGVASGTDSNTPDGQTGTSSMYPYIVIRLPRLEPVSYTHLDYGVIDGTYEGTPGFMEQWVQFGYQYPEGESLLKVVQRVYNFLDDIKQRYADKKVMVISHGGVCRVINSYFCLLYTSRCV